MEDKPVRVKSETTNHEWYVSIFNDTTKLLKGEYYIIVFDEETKLAVMIHLASVFSVEDVETINEKDGLLERYQRDYGKENVACIRINERIPEADMYSFYNVYSDITDFDVILEKMGLLQSSIPENN